MKKNPSKQICNYKTYSAVTIGVQGHSTATSQKNPQIKKIVVQFFLIVRICCLCLMWYELNIFEFWSAGWLNWGIKRHYLALKEIVKDIVEAPNAIIYVRWYRKIHDLIRHHARSQTFIVLLMFMKSGLPYTPIFHQIKQLTCGEWCCNRLRGNIPLYCD